MHLFVCIALLANMMQLQPTDSIKQNYAPALDSMFDDGKVQTIHVYQIYKVRPSGYKEYTLTPSTDTFLIAATGLRKVNKNKRDSEARWGDIVGQICYGINGELHKSDIGQDFFHTVAAEGWLYDELEILLLEGDELLDYKNSELSQSNIIIREQRKGRCVCLSNHTVFQNLDHLLQYITLVTEAVGKTDSLSKQLYPLVEKKLCDGAIRTIRTFPISSFCFNRNGVDVITSDTMHFIATTFYDKSSIRVGDARHSNIVGRVGYSDGKQFYISNFGHQFFKTLAKENWNYDDIEILRLNEDVLIDDFVTAKIIVRNVKNFRCAEMYNGKIYSSIWHYMQNQHGGVAAYIDELTLKQKIDDHIKKNMPKTYQELLNYMDSSLYFYLWRYINAEDTAKIANWFIKDICNIVSLKNDVKQQLYNIILKKLSAHKKINFDIWDYMSKEVRSMMSLEQYEHVVEKMTLKRALEHKVFREAFVNFYPLQNQGVIPKEYDWERWTKRYITNYRVEIMGEEPVPVEKPKGIIIK